jgi:hypothetical protein
MQVALHAGDSLRLLLENPSAFGINKGYVSAWHGEPAPGLPQRPLGLAVTVEFASTSLEAAEDHSIALGERLSTICSFFAGGPRLPAKLRRLARVTLEGHLQEQWD